MKPFLAQVATADNAPGGRKSLESAVKWPSMQRLPVRMRVKIKLPGIQLRALTELKVGQVIGSDWPACGEVPLYAQNVALGWCEFEVVEGSIAVRLTRLV